MCHFFPCAICSMRIVISVISNVFLIKSFPFSALDVSWIEQSMNDVWRNPWEMNMMISIHQHCEMCHRERYSVRRSIRFGSMKIYLLVLRLMWYSGFHEIALPQLNTSRITFRRRIFTMRRFFVTNTPFNDKL